MQIQWQSSAREVKGMNTQELRANFLIPDLMKADEVTLVYSHYDRVIVGGVMPLSKTVHLHFEPELKANYFLERRELGIINTGGAGTVHAGGIKYDLDKLEALYVSKGTTEVTFTSKSKDEPACFFLMSAAAHAEFPTTKITKEQAMPVQLGDITTSSKRTIYKYIHDDGAKSCQLVMGLTLLESGSVWNSIPPHTHTRRTEVYFYFDLPATHRVFHFMGQPTETRHLVMANHEAVVSPPWSVHFGSGTSNYGFIWAMAGENKAFNDMDQVAVTELQ